MPIYKTKKRNRKIKTDLNTKPTDTHQFLDSTSCQLAVSKNVIAASAFISQALCVR